MFSHSPHILLLLLLPWLTQHCAGQTPRPSEPGPDASGSRLRGPRSSLELSLDRIRPEAPQRRLSFQVGGARSSFQAGSRHRVQSAIATGRYQERTEMAEDGLVEGESWRRVRGEPQPRQSGEERAAMLRSPSWWRTTAGRHLGWSTHTPYAAQRSVLPHSSALSTSAVPLSLGAESLTCEPSYEWLRERMGPEHAPQPGRLYFVKRRIGRWNGPLQRRTSTALLFGMVERDPRDPTRRQLVWDFAHLITDPHSGNWANGLPGWAMRIGGGTLAHLHPPVLLLSEVSSARAPPRPRTLAASTISWGTDRRPA